MPVQAELKYDVIVERVRHKGAVTINGNTLYFTLVVDISSNQSGITDPFTLALGNRPL